MLILTVFLMLGSASAGFLDFLGDSQEDITNDNQTFVVGFNPEFPPFTYMDDNGNYIGFDLDLAKEVARRNNWTFEAVPIIDWNTKQFELNSGEIDCLWSEFTINGREDDYTFSDPYFNNEKLVIVKADSDINKLSDLKGKILEVQQGSSILNALNGDNKTLKDTFADIQEVSGYDVALMDLQSGVCDFVIADSGLAHYQIAEKFDGKSFRILNESITQEQYGVGFKKGNTDLKNQVQKTLDEMYDDGTVDKIAQNYTDYGIPEGLIHP